MGWFWLCHFFVVILTGSKLLLTVISSKTGWVICCLIDEEIVGLRASTLDEAKDLADGLALASHMRECDDDCNEWELLKDDG